MFYKKSRFTFTKREFSIAIVPNSEKERPGWGLDFCALKEAARRHVPDAGRDEAERRSHESLEAGALAVRGLRAH